jgi:hypothetical protein
MQNNPHNAAPIIWWGDPKERDHLENLGVDGKITLFTPMQDDSKMTPPQPQIKYVLQVKICLSKFKMTPKK